MYTEARKLHLLEEVIKVVDEATLIKLEIVLEKAKKNVSKPKKKPSIYDFADIFSKEEVNEMRKVIHETCEQVHPDDLK